MSAIKTVADITAKLIVKGLLARRIYALTITPATNKIRFKREENGRWQESDIDVFEDSFDETHAKAVELWRQKRDEYAQKLKDAGVED